VTRCWISFCALMMCLVAGTAHAESRIAVRPFFGPHADDVRREVLAILSRHRELVLVPGGEVEERATRLGVDPNAPEGRVAIAGALHVSAWVEAIVQRQGKELRATVLVYDGQEHRRIARTVVTRRSPRELSRALQQNFWRENRDAILSADAPRDNGDTAEPVAENSPSIEEAPESEAKEAPPTVEPTQQTIAPAEPSVPAESPAPSSMALGTVQTFSSARWNVSPAGASDPKETRDALITSLTIGTLSRSLKYQDPEYTQSLGNYSLPLAPQASLDVRYYPGAHLTAAWPSYFGLDLKAQLALAAASETKSGDKYSTSADFYSLGARGRLPLARHEVSLLAAYGIRRMKFADSKAKPSPTPDVDYRYLHTGAEGDFAMGDKLRLGLSAGWLWLMSGGELTSKAWFSRATGSGIEGSIFGSYGLTKHIDLFATVGISHFFLSFNPKKGDPKIAGGATDDFVTGGIGIRFRL